MQGLGLSGQGKATVVEGVCLDNLIMELPLHVAHGPGRRLITSLSDDSRQVNDDGGCLFVARRGVEDDGRTHIDHAIARGAVAVVTDRLPPDLDTKRREAVTWVVGSPIDQALAGTLAERYHNQPSKKLNLIGVTGTNGKTTTGWLLAHLLQATGARCGLIGTIVVDDGQRVRPAQLTTPGAIELSSLLAQMVHHGCETAVMEVSSHALQQGRTAALTFDAAVFTNLTGDHLDYHHGMADYASAKAILFDGLATNAWAVVNGDDKYTTRILHDCAANVMICRIAGKASGPSDCCASVLALTSDHSRVRFDGPWGSVDLTLPMVGRHNVANALMALAAAATVTELTGDQCRHLEHCPPVPGRLEPVGLDDGGGPTVLVDYAHTHDALKNVLNALRPVVRGDLVVMFGCGGNRDRTKRPKMAGVACALADRVVITSDNPRTEVHNAIIEQIIAGVPEGFPVIIEPDRSSAIKRTITEAGDADTVLLAGKGHEPYQEIGTTRYDFDDRCCAAEALRKRTDLHMSP